jgi:hypothetical protein
MARHVSPQVGAAVPLRCVTGPPQRRRPNLVFFRCGAQSLHRRLYPLPADRNWDCALSCYQPPLADDEQAEYVLTGGVSKWDAFAQARFEQPQLGFDAYERFFLVDDDIEFRSATDIHALFKVAQEQQLTVCQPSLSASSYASWLVTRHHPGFFLRYVNYVESMMPMLTGEAVRLLEADLRAAVSGWGLDCIFYKVVGAERRMAVVDAITVSHTKVIDPENGPFYLYLRSIGVDPREELAWFLARYGLTNFGATTSGGMPLTQSVYPLGEKT